MRVSELREAYQRFFEEKGHQRIHSASLLPKNGATVLFNTAGMQPLAPYLMGEPHPGGKRLVDVQKCLRTDDIDEVGDNSHLTFFEMLGNWSLGDYFKRESLSWSHEFLTQVLKINPERLAVTLFQGDKDAPRDEESAEIWRSLGISADRIHYLGKKDNWWGPVGNSGPCGPDSEIFYDTGLPDHEGCRPGCECGKWLEIWNNVFMEYFRTPEGEYQKLPQPNVDTGMGLERTVAVLSGEKDLYQVDSLAPIIRRLEEISGHSYSDEGKRKAFRVIADHLRAATFAIGDGAVPSNVEAGYIVRRLIRRAVRWGRELDIRTHFSADIAGVVVETFGEAYPELREERARIEGEMGREEEKFQRALERGLREFRKVQERLRNRGEKEVPAAEAFTLFEAYGFPLPLTVELAREQGLTVDEAGFATLLERHREISRRGMERKFQGGLAEQGEETTRFHTATHLLHQALRTVLGPTVQQMGSNITVERLRFDFSHPERLTDPQLAEVERIVNEQIALDLPVTREMMTLDEATASGALAFFGERYGSEVSVYSIGSFSREVCGGPHVERTGGLGRFRITKQESTGQKVRRVRAVLEATRESPEEKNSQVSEESKEERRQGSISR